MEPAEPAVTSFPSVRATAVPAVTIQRSAVVSWVSGGSSPATMRTFAEMFVGPSNRRELLRLSASFSFHRASMSAAGQNIVFPTASFGTGGAAAPPPCRAPWAFSVRPAMAIAADAASSLLRIIGPLSMALRQADPDVEGRLCQPDSAGWRRVLLSRSSRTRSIRGRMSASF